MKFKKIQIAFLLFLAVCLVKIPLYGQVYPASGTFAPSAANQIPFFTSIGSPDYIGGSSNLVYDPTTGNITVLNTSWYNGIDLNGDRAQMTIEGYESQLYFPSSYSAIWLAGPNQEIIMNGSNSQLNIEGDNPIMTLAGSSSTTLNLTGVSPVLNLGTASSVGMINMVTPTIGGTTSGTYLYNSGGSLYWGLTDISDNILPTATTDQTLYYNGSSWTPTSNFTNNGSNITLSGATPQFTISGSSSSELILSGANGGLINLATTPGTTSGSYLYNYSGALYWGLTDISDNILPTATSDQTLYYNGTSWAATSNFENDGTDLYMYGDYSSLNFSSNYQHFDIWGDASEIGFAGDNSLISFSGTGAQILMYASNQSINLQGDNSQINMNGSSPTVNIGTTSSSGIVTVYGEILTVDNTGTYNFQVTSAGDVHARTLLLDMTTITPDYVFAKDYKLMPLDTLQAYLAINNHLPDVPSACELEEKGKVNVGEMQTTLLKKVEELTLYTIDMNKKMEALEAQNAELQKQIKGLQNK